MAIMNLVFNHLCDKGSNSSTSVESAFRQGYNTAEDQRIEELLFKQDPSLKKKIALFKKSSQWN